MAGRRIIIPREVLASEIEFAIAYTVAANPDDARYFLMPEPEGRRRAFAEAIVRQLAERAGSGLSGMRVVSGEGEAGQG